jgi:hypothetical protein
MTKTLPRVARWGRDTQSALDANRVPGAACRVRPPRQQVGRAVTQKVTNVHFAPSTLRGGV